MTAPRLVMIESPYAGDVDRNVDYARRCILDLDRGEAPFAMHLHYPQVLDDRDPLHRATGIRAGLAWLERADLVALYIDRGESPGMRQALTRAAVADIPVEFRSLQGTRLERPGAR